LTRPGTLPSSGEAATLRKERQVSDSDIRPYRLAVPDQAIADLRDRLRRTRWPDDYIDHGWDLGTDQTYLKALCEYWANGYDWRSREAKLNAWPHFIAPIDGHAVHFIRAKSAVPNAQPLLITHGWPGSFRAGERITPPFGFARFPREFIKPPREWPERFFDVAHWTDMPRGGHFAALEQPELLAEDIRKFFRAMRA